MQQLNTEASLEGKIEQRKQHYLPLVPILMTAVLVWVCCSTAIEDLVTKIFLRWFGTEELWQVKVNPRAETDPLLKFEQKGLVLIRKGSWFRLQLDMVSIELDGWEVSLIINLWTNVVLSEILGVLGLTTYPPGHPQQSCHVSLWKTLKFVEWSPVPSVWPDFLGYQAIFLQYASTNSCLE